jgi:molecular chaperone DnaK
LIVRVGDKPAFGLDFGTTTTLAASTDGPLWIGTTWPWLLSLVGYEPDGSVVVGEAAQHAQPGQRIRSIKRAITRRRTHVRVDAPAGVRDVQVDDLILEILRTASRRVWRMGVDPFDQVRLHLGCPAMWDGDQRRRLLEIAHRAGLPVTLATLVDEPVAAGIAWLSSRPAGEPDPGRIVVFDMGGGSLDVAVLDARGAGQVCVLAAVGIAEAGDALDEEIADDLDDALAMAGIDIDALPHRPYVVEDLLLDAARRLKVELTRLAEDVVVLDPRVFGRNEVWYRRDQLDAAFAPQMDRAMECVASALRAARLTELPPDAAYDIARMPIEHLVGGVDVVLLSGGMSQVPLVERRIRAVFPTPTRVELAATPPETAVALGLALADRYRRISMFRPAVDIRLEWGREERTVYEAYTPLVESWQILRGDRDLRFIRTGRELGLPGQTTGRLRVVSHTDDAIPASLGGTGMDGFPVVLGERFELSIHPSGRIRVVDEAGTHEGQLHV